MKIKTTIEIDVRPIRVEQERIVFPCILKNGVASVAPEINDAANKIAAHIGRKIVDIRGNNQWTWFYFDEWITEDEAIRAEEYVEALDDNA